MLDPLPEDEIFLSLRPDHLLVELFLELVGELGSPSLIQCHSGMAASQSVESDLDPYHVVRSAEPVVGTGRALGTSPAFRST